MKNRIAHVILTVVLIIAMVLLSAITASAATINTYYLDSKGNRQTVSNVTEITKGGDYGPGWYILRGNFTGENSLNTINFSGQGDVNLILEDGSDVTINGSVHLSGVSFTIYAQSKSSLTEGKLTIRGRDDAGIGTVYKGICGHIFINGGYINVSAGTTGAGIGTGEYGTCGCITINGGNVTAKGGFYGAGIGTGLSDNTEAGHGFSVIYINGGNVTATGGFDGAGIGTSDMGMGKGIVINGGYVTAIGGEGDNAGIGLGVHSYLEYININGGFIRAKSNIQPIGAGYKSSISNVNYAQSCKCVDKHGWYCVNFEPFAAIQSSCTQAGHKEYFKNLQNEKFYSAFSFTDENLISNIDEWMSEGNPGYIAPPEVITHPAQQPTTFNYKTGVIHGWKEYYECIHGDLFAKCENGILSDQIKDIEAWKKGEGCIKGEETVKITFKDKDKTTVVYNLKGQTLPDYVFPMPVFDEESVFLEWKAPDQTHFDCTVETLSDLIITADRSKVSDIYNRKSAPLVSNRKTALSRNVYIISENHFVTSNRLTVQDWAVIIVPDGVSARFSSGIHLVSGATLIIMSPKGGKGTGSITAKGLSSSAGIGGVKYEAGGNVAIYNSTIRASGGAGAAGIGGGERGNGGSVSVLGGTIIATGGIHAAGIGGGWYGGGPKALFKGGEVYAYGTENAAGTGKGADCNEDRWEEIHLGNTIRVWDITKDEPGVILDRVTTDLLDGISKVHITGLGDSPNKYLIIKGENQTIFKNADCAVFASDAPFVLFENVEVDGKNVPKKYYHATSGSTVITFNSSYIKALKLGEHNLRIISKDGFATTDFKVAEALPKTGDSTNPALLTMLLIASVGAILLTCVMKKKKRS